ncbi:MAG: helix-turn-helix domain-containing protein [Clostridia bacterium]|jgi:excisionase family DNA binding protein|nr:helix-turn-helix domain-containing protein [Clostridia bacterium]MBR3874528.1 helix-turn-helix domain-containing protein [Clostridia bacterium]
MDQSIRKEATMKSLTATSQADPSVAKTYRVEDIAKILDIGRSSAYNLVREGHFKTVRIGTAIRISRKSFDEWLESQAI